ncbi:PTS mannose transporter subunit IIAB [Candidatus Riesia sp. GBBU]|nr:PTS mannose transporter subunit IIAB [Candidatus Riesia sp. GBBU]
MSIGIIVSTHGVSAEYIIKTSEMLTGNQKNIGYVNFLSNESSELLIKKLLKKIQEIDISEGILFLVDIWGGTPFNIINKVMIEKGRKNYDIISGVNVPMLVELFLIREEECKVDRIVNLITEVGRKEIKSFNHSINKDIKNKNSNEFFKNPCNLNRRDCINIVLARIDDRLIHGQVSTVWTKVTKIKRIIVISDEIFSDKIRTKLLKQAAPPGVSSHIVSIEKYIRVHRNPKYFGEKVMLLFNNPKDVLRIVEKGIKIESVNIGGMSFKKGKKQITQSVSVSQEDINSFIKLSSIGIDLEIRKVPSDKSVNIIPLIKRASEK